MKSNHKKKSPIGIIVSISFVLFIAIGGSVYYKYNAAQSLAANDSPAAEQSQPTEVEKPVEEKTEPQNEEVLTKPTTEEPSKNTASEQKNEANEQPVNKKPQLENGYIVDQKPVTEPTYVKDVLIVNKKFPLPANYNKGEDPAARAAFEKMAAAAKSEGIELVAFSGFRSYEYQTTLYDRYVNKDGKDAADRYSARPGYSEHQTGLAFDIGEKGREDLWLTKAFGETKAGQWLVKNAHNYGFILRYPEGKEDITGFMYESWHFRYLEGNLAKKVYESGVTLEEYLGLE